MRDFEQFSLQILFKRDYVNYYEHGRTVVCTQKAMLFNCCLLQKFGVVLAFHLVSQKPRDFIEVASQAYHAGFHSCYYLASPVNYTNSPWLQRTEKITKNPSIFCNFFCTLICFLNNSLNGTTTWPGRPALAAAMAGLPGQVAIPFKLLLRTLFTKYVHLQCI